MMHDLFLVSPMIVVVVGAFVLLFLGYSKMFSGDKLNLVTVSILTVVLGLEYNFFGNDTSSFVLKNIFDDSFIYDDFALLFDMMFTAGALFTLLISNDFFKAQKDLKGEYFALILLSVFGMMLLSHAHELLTAFIALEIASLSVYSLIGYHQSAKVHSEAMMKYMVLGSMTGAFFIIGTALIYGAVGSTSLNNITYYISMHDIKEMQMLLVGSSFILVTIMFKVGAVPFHSWIVDVYHGSPYPITMFMATTFKIAIFAIALRLHIVGFETVSGFWSEILQVLTILTLIGGSWLAISQSLIKRMLAGSAIVHSGYLLIAISSIDLGSKLAAPAIMFYLIAYFISAVGSFGILSFMASQGYKQLRYEEFKGFASKRPYLALMMSIFMLSLAGFPSTIGFLGKFYIFSSAIESGQILLAGLGILTAFISVYYYFKLIAVMYFYPTHMHHTKTPIDISTVLIALMAFAAVWGGVGSSLIPGIAGADGFIEAAKLAIEALE